MMGDLWIYLVSILFKKRAEMRMTFYPSGHRSCSIISFVAFYMTLSFSAASNISPALASM